MLKIRIRYIFTSKTGRLMYSTCLHIKTPEQDLVVDSKNKLASSTIKRVLVHQVYSSYLEQNLQIGVKDTSSRISQTKISTREL